MAKCVLSQKEVDAVLMTDAPTRMLYTVKRVADWEEIWTLTTIDGFVLLGSNDGVERVPVWPFIEFAQQCCNGKWADAKPFCISLDKFMNKWIPGMITDQRQVAVFPTPNDQATVLSATNFKAVLDEALSEFE